MQVPFRLNAVNGWPFLFRGVRELVDLPEGKEAVVAAAADADQPVSLAVELKAIDHALVALRARRRARPRHLPVPNLQVDETPHAIDVFDLAHAADGELVAVVRENQGTDAAQ